MATTTDTESTPNPPPARGFRRDQRKLSERFRRENPTYIRTFVSISVARTGSFFAKRLPNSVRYAIADRMGDLNYALIPGYRRNVMDNLRHVHLGANLPPPTTKDVRHVFQMSARNWADLLIAPGHTVEQFISEVKLTPNSQANLENALAEGHGCILVTAHVGAFDYIGHTLHAMGYPLVIMTGRTTSRLVFDGVTYLRKANGMPCIEANAAGVRKALQAVHAGGCAVVVCDRDFFHNGITMPFFEKETTLPRGAVRIARDTGALIVPVYGRRVKGGHEMKIYPAIRMERTSDTAADLRGGLEKIVVTMEEAISAAPNQWVMFQSVWPLEESVSAD